MIAIRGKRAKRLLVRGVHVLDPRDGSVRKRQDLLLERGRIEAIGPAGELNRDGALVIDATGYHALPGLIDCHLHVCGVYLLDPPGPREAPGLPRQMLKNLRALAESGVTTARDMGAPLKLARLWRRLALTGRIVSPRILTPGPVFTAPGGYPAFIEELPAPLAFAIGQVKVGLRSRQDAFRWVDRLAEQGVDHIKAIYTSEDYDDARSPLPRLADELVVALCERAHHHNLALAVHHIWKKDLGPLLRLPFDSLEHITIDGVMEPEHLKQLRERDLPVTTTFMTYGIIDFIDELLELIERHGERLFEPAQRALIRRMVDEIRFRTYGIPGFGRAVIETGMRYGLENLRRLREAGVRVVAGTDSGGAITPCGQIVWELRAFVRGGCTDLEAVRAVTSDAAVAVGRPDLGVLEVGRTADVVLCRGNPAQDVRALEQVEVVVRDGLVLKNLIGTVEV
ncbi:MAG: amidohydrolase family protein [bacterium]